MDDRGIVVMQLPAGENHLDWLQSLLEENHLDWLQNLHNCLFNG
jgi:hypothetical protein